MATAWQTFPIEFQGGLISNMSGLQHGLNAVGSATTLQNFEPSRKGGYAKILGYEKFSSLTVPGVGEVLGLKVLSKNKIIAARVLDSSAVTTYGPDNTNALNLSFLTATKLQQRDTGRIAYYILDLDEATPAWKFLYKSEKRPTTTNVRIKHAELNIGGRTTVVFTDGINAPATYGVTSATTMGSIGSIYGGDDTYGSNHIVIFKNTAFYASGTKLIFSAPSTVNDLTAANGAGVIDLNFRITGLIVFREQLIIFTESTIKRLTGSTSSDYAISPITEKIGCVDGRSIQEFGGDIMYLSSDGLRLLSATDRIGDFALDVASDTIYKTSIDFLDITEAKFESLVVRGKSQYRIFAYKDGYDSSLAEGLIATKYMSQGGQGIAWSTTKGIKVYVADGTYENENETILFANEDGYIYRLETGVSFDGSNIPSIYQSPNLPLTDPQIRKTIYKLALYIQPSGLMNLDVSLKYDFEQLLDSTSNSSYGAPIQPDPVTVTSGGSKAFFYGGSNSLYGSAQYVNVLDTVYSSNVVGSCRTVAIKIENDSTDPTFTLDAAVLEFAQEDRQ